jgi:cysteine desulfurase
VTYLDAASSEPLSPAAREAFLAALDAGWADPRRLHREGRRARLLVDQARETVASLIGARADEITFTTSGTDAIWRGVGGLATRSAPGGRCLVCAVEHSAVIKATEWVARGPGAVSDVVLVPVDADGRLDLGAFADLVGTGDAMACVQTANHEVGTLQPVAEAWEVAAAIGVPLVVDAGASAGRIPVPETWSVLSASAHKWGGPAGVGVLGVRASLNWRPLGPWAAPDSDTTSGRAYANIPAIVSAAIALETSLAESEATNARLSRLVDRLRDRLPRVVPDLQVHGPAEGRLPHIVSFSVLYLDGEALVTELDREGFAVSSGSACTSDTLQPSHVLAAMGVLTHGNVRVSLPVTTTDAEIESFLAVLPQVVTRLRSAAGVSEL